MEPVTFVSTNAGKAREVRQILGEFGIPVAWKRRSLPEPQADSLAAVTRSKLRAARSAGRSVLVEDSGLFIDSLHGFPGVYSAHVLRIWGFGPILELLRKRPRSATFRASVGWTDGRTVRLFAGEVRGSIAPRPRGSGGFGYDPIFVPEGWSRTFAEVPTAEKDRVSHRARAFRAAGRFLVRSRGAPD
ncbi:MAG: non-canonical purine NTP pyrophosphatase [Thermoplasmata archaeon]